MDLLVLLQMDRLQEFLFALVAGVGKVHPVLPQMVLQLALLLELPVRTMGTPQPLESLMVGHVHVQLTDLREAGRAVDAAILLHFVMRLHVIVEVRHLKGEGGLITSAIMFLNPNSLEQTTGHSPSRCKQTAAPRCAASDGCSGL